MVTEPVAVLKKKFNTLNYYTFFIEMDFRNISISCGELNFFFNTATGSVTIATTFRSWMNDRKIIGFSLNLPVGIPPSRLQRFGLKPIF